MLDPTRDRHPPDTRSLQALSEGARMSATGETGLERAAADEASAVGRSDRAPSSLRPVTIVTGVQRHPAGSVRIDAGATSVLVAVSIEERGPRWRDGGGWVTAEYAMLPGSTDRRSRRERSGAGGRSKEIERLIGRSLRAAVDLEMLPDVTVTVDCDVLSADGGTRTAAITGGWVALSLALRGAGLEAALIRQITAVSVGVVADVPLLDLDQREDNAASVDMNVVATADGELVEVQGTAEGPPFARARHDELLDLALAGCRELASLQRHALSTAAGA
jgi:ribonuclease PH